MSDRRGSPTIRRRQLGIELKRLRERANLTIDELARLTGKSSSHLSRIERAETGASVATVEQLLTAFDVDNDVREELLLVAKEANQRGWWQRSRYRDAIGGPYATLIGFESAATSIKAFEPTLMPGLLQTPAYARASFQRGLERLLEDDIAARIEVRRQRQAILDQPDAPEFWVVLDEAVIRRVVGGPSVMREQLLHVVEMASRPNIEVHVIPFRAGGHPGTLGPFVVLSFPEGQTDVVYLESMAGDIYPEHRLSWYGDVFERLSADALSLGDSVDLISEVAKGL